MEIKKLKQLISEQLIENVDVSDLDVNGIDFSGCTLKNVSFSNEALANKTLKEINFKDATLENVIFDHATLENCNFDISEKSETPSLSSVSFKNCHILSCRFRNAHISWSDFRYAEISHITFESAQINFCDFYRAFFVGVAIFRKSQISNSSLFYTYFDEGSTIRKENLSNNTLLQENHKRYRKFLIEWNTYGTGERKNNQKNTKSDWSPKESLKSRYADAEDIFKSLSGLWMSKGFIGDANWAYVRGRKMERKRMVAELSSDKITTLNKLTHLVRIFWNFLSDIMFGYGESIRKMVLTYIFMVMLFGFFYYALPEVSLKSYVHAIKISFKNMVAMSPDEMQNISPLVDFLNLIQTTLGILITGIFGFILGNKIRNQ